MANTSTSSEESSTLEAFLERIVVVNNELQRSSNEPRLATNNPEFNLATFWQNLLNSARNLSAQALKLAILSKPPYPTDKELAELITPMNLSLFGIASSFYSFQRSAGLTLYKLLRSKIAIIVSSLHAFVTLTIDISNSSDSSNQIARAAEKLVEACEDLEKMQKDNSQACLYIIKSSKDLCKDALGEAQQVIADNGDDGSGCTWTVKDKNIAHTAIGLIKVTIATLNKLLPAVKATDCGNDESQNRDLDNLMMNVKQLSPRLDNLVISLYAPVTYENVENYATELCDSILNILQFTRASYFCKEDDMEWVNFLENACRHNVEKMKATIQQ